MQKFLYTRYTSKCDIYPLTSLTFILLPGHLLERRAQVRPCSAWASPSMGSAHFPKDAHGIRIVRLFASLLVNGIFVK